MMCNKTTDTNINNLQIGLKCNNTLIPIYFQHKFADDISSFQKFILFGTYPISNKDKCKYTQLIENCDNSNYFKRENENKNLCRTSYSDFTTGKNQSDLCTQTYYKQIIYTINNIPLSKTNTFSENLRKINKSTNFFKQKYLKYKQKYLKFKSS